MGVFVYDGVCGGMCVWRGCEILRGMREGVCGRDECVWGGKGGMCVCMPVTYCRCLLVLGAV